MFRTMTIFPGDIIGTGTIGMGCSMDIHKWPQIGQQMTFTMEGIGSMTLKIVKGNERAVTSNVAWPSLEYPGEDI